MACCLLHRLCLLAYWRRRYGSVGIWNHDWRLGVAECSWSGAWTADVFTRRLWSAAVWRFVSSLQNKLCSGGCKKRLGARSLSQRWNRVTCHRVSDFGRVGSVSDPVFDPVLSFNIGVYRGVVTTSLVYLLQLVPVILTYYYVLICHWAVWISRQITSTRPLSRYCNMCFKTLNDRVGSGRVTWSTLKSHRVTGQKSWPDSISALTVNFPLISRSQTQMNSHQMQ